MLIREARDTELDEVLGVNRSAFGRDEEALLVGELLHDPTAQPLLSLVAVDHGRLVGHVLFTAANLTGPDQPVRCSLLAPLAVVPSHQRAGLGHTLIKQGCERLARAGVALVFVLGHPGYYTRCGFYPAYPLGLNAPHPVEPAAAWMVRALVRQGPGVFKGTVSCATAIAAEHYWRE